MKGLFFVALLLLSVSCKENKPAEAEVQSKEPYFKHYVMSEMALMMEQMYVDNLRIKEAILSESMEVDSLPAYYLQLEKAVMTDPSDRDLFFNTQLTEFIKAQRLVYEVSTDRKENFNAMVESCITCHKVKCGGPIERIKKLLIH